MCQIKLVVAYGENQWSTCEEHSFTFDTLSFPVLLIQLLFAVQTFARHEDVDKRFVFIIMLLLVPETEVGIIAPGSPGNIKLVEDYRDFHS